jgi:hypothetical protein
LIALLWVRPRGAQDDTAEKSKLNRISKAVIGNVVKPTLKHTISKEIRYQEMDFFVTIAHAIAGGVESPLQLTFQVGTSGMVESMG